MNANQKKFVKNRIKGMSRTEAYMDAYGTEDRVYARTAASRLMNTNDRVREAMRNYLDGAIQEAQELLEADSTEAAETLIELRKDGSKEDGVRIRAAQDILDRAGLKPVEKAEIFGSLDISVELPEGVTLADI